MARFARCPKCGALNDGCAPHCYLCGASPLLTACPVCGDEVRNPILPNCQKCGTPYAPRAYERHEEDGSVDEASGRIGSLVSHAFRNMSSKKY